MVMEEVQTQDVTQEQIKGEMDIKKENTTELAPEENKVNTNGTNGVSKDGIQIPISSVPKDAVDEWPTPKQIHSFYFVKYRSLEDPKLKVKIEQAEKDIQKKNQARVQLTDALKAKRSERADVISKLKPLSSEEKEYRMTVGTKRKEMRPLQDALGEMRNANNAAREKGMGLCSSEEELDDIIRSLHYRMQHESLTLNVEKTLLKEIKQLEGTRAQVIANSAERAKIQDSLGQKQVLQGQVKVISGDIDEVRKEQLAIKSKISVLETDLNIINQAISSLQEELEAITEKRNQAYESLKELRAAREEMNVGYFRNRTLLNSAKDLAVKKDVSEIQKLCYTEVENFMSEWSSNKAVREDYEKRILLSLDMRQLSRDGRMRNPDEKPILYEPPMSKEPETASLKKGGKEDVHPIAQPDVAPVAKVQDDNLSKASQKTQDDNLTKRSEKKLTSKASGLEDSEDSFEIEKPQKELPKAVNPAKLKELKREEEIAKAKQALERKKKLADKTAAKAAMRAQKDAEKKLKEKEKKAKKKAGVLATPDPDAPAEETETDTKVPEAEEENENLDAPVPAKSKEPKQTLKYRRRPKSEQIPKIMLKRKKSSSYWLWAAPMAAAIVVLAMLGYYIAVLRN